MREASGANHASPLSEEFTKLAKKPRGFLAGLFANTLSQTLRSLEGKRPDATKSQLLAGGHAATGKEPKANGGGKKLGEAAKKAIGAYAAPTPGKLLLSSLPTKGPAEAHGAEDAKDRKKADKKLQGQAGEPVVVDLAAVKPGDGGRKPQGANGPGADAIAAGQPRRLDARAAASVALAQKPKVAGAEPERGEDDKKKERAASEVKVSLLDLRRSPEAKRNAAAQSPGKDQQSGELPIKDAPRESKPGPGHREIVRDFVLDPVQAREAKFQPKSEYAAPASGQDFRSLLAQKLGESWNGEIVKSAHIVLRDGDAGTIRLRLKPESLGNVKIELNLSDNNISGRILVESDEAKSAFERNMNQLADAFMQGGFDSARLEVAVGGGSQQGAAGYGSKDSSGPFYSERLRSAVGSSADPATAGAAYSRRGGAVDILA